MAQTIVANGTALDLSGTINTGGGNGILVEGTSSNTDLILTASTTLTGAGTVMLEGAFSRIYGNSGSGNALDNQNNLIEGSGQIGINNGGANLTLINEAAGTIDANTTATLGLYLAGSPAASNAGLMEATGSGGLLIEDGTVNNTGTVLASGANNNVVLSSAAIAGGTLATTGGGLIETATGTTNSLNGSTAAVTITAGSTVQVTDNSSLNLDGTIDNAGTIVNATTADSTNIVVNTATVTLTGGGTIDMAGANARIYGPDASGNTLDLVNQTILGAGQIGINSGGANLTLVNTAGGKIDANTTATLGLYLAGSPAASNAGLMEATGSGGLLIQDGTVNNTGTVLARGAGDNVVLSNATIAGGKLATTGGGLIETAAGTTNSLNGSSAAVVITAHSTVQATENSSLNLDGTIDNTGTILDNAGTDDTNIILAGTLTALTGGGVLDLGSATARIYGNNGSANTLDLVRQTILGAGQIGINSGGANLTLVNTAGGTIDANTTATLGLYLAGSPAASNAGLMEATGSGGLLIEDGTVNNTGTVLASGAGNNVVLSNAAIAGGTLATTGAGLIETAGGSTTNSLNGSTAAVTITAGSTVQVTDNSSLNLDGTIDNAGTIVNATTADSTNILVNTATVTLTGGGTIDMAGPAARIYGPDASGNTLDLVNQTILGAGQIGINNGGANLTLVNTAAGTIDASTTATLGLDLAGSPAASNAGLMEATGSGGLLIAGGTVNNTGTIQASGTNDNVVLSNATIAGGRLASTGGGLIETAGGSTTNSLNGSTAAVTITAGSTVQITDNSSLNLDGTIDNAGTIVNATTADSTNILVNTATVTLTGGGTIDMAGANARIYGPNANGNTLDLVRQTILGAGQIGIANGGANLALAIGGAGTIDASGTTALTIQPGGPAVTNDGVLEGTGSGGLALFGTVITVGNTGTVQALDGSSVTFDSNVTTNNNSGGTLAGGTWGAISSGDGATLSITGGSIVVDKATIVLSGANSVVQSLQGGSEVAIETSLKTIDPRSELAVLGGRNYATTNSIADSGLLQLGGGTFTAGHLAVGRTGTIDGSGTVAGGRGVANSGLIEANGGTLDLTGSLVNNAQVTVEAGTVILGGAVVASTGKVGSIAIGTGTDAKFLSTVSAAESAVFTGTAGTLTLDKPTRFAGTIDQFGTTDTIDLALLAPRHVTGATIETGNKLVVLETAGSITLQLDPNQSFAGLTPHAGTDGSGGTAITLVGSVIAAARPSFIASPSAPAAGPDMAAMFTAGSPLSDVLGGLVPAGGDVLANPGSPDLGAAPFGSGPDGTALWLSQSHTAGPPLLAHGN